MNAPLRTLGSTALLVLLVMGVGCSQPGHPAEPFTGSAVPLALDDAMLFLGDGDSGALLMDVGGERAAITRMELPGGRCHGQRQPGIKAARAVVLCDGLDATRSEDAVPAHLLVFDAGGERERYPLHGRFAQFQLSGDGRFAFVFEAVGSIVFGTEVAFVDLDESPGRANPTSVSVRSLTGEEPLGVVFSDEIDVVGSPRRLAAVLSEGHVNLVDLAHPAREAITVPLTLEGSRGVIPEDVLFGDQTIYVRASGLDHVLALSLHPAESSGATHDFSVSPFQLATGKPIREMLRLPRDAGDLLLALSGQSVYLIDPSTGVATGVPTGSSHNQMLRFRGSSPGDSNTRDRALLFGSSSEVAFLDLGGLDLEGGETRLARNLEVVDLSRDVVGAFALLSQGRVAFQHADGTHLSIVDLSGRTVVPVRTQVSISDAELDADTARLWVTTVTGSVATLSLDSLEVQEVVLDAAVESLVLLPGTQPRIVAIHPDLKRGGYLTLLDADNPSRETAVSHGGFLLDGLLDRRQP